MAGIKLSTIEVFDPFFSVDASSGLDIWSVEEGYMNQKEGYENGGSIDRLHQNPWYVSSMAPYTPTALTKVSFLIADYVTRLTGPNMKAFQMSPTDNTILVHRFDKDIITLSGFVYWYGSSGGYTSKPSALGAPSGYSKLGDNTNIQINSILSANYSFTHSPQNEDSFMEVYLCGAVKRIINSQVLM